MLRHNEEHPQPTGLLGFPPAQHVPNQGGEGQPNMRRSARNGEVTRHDIEARRFTTS